jgi:hypothetical protein
MTRQHAAQLLWIAEREAGARTRQRLVNGGRPVPGPFN